MKYGIPAFLICAMVGLARAEVKPAAIFSDGMVLQRQMAVPVWGTADKGEKVTVTFRGQQVSATADDQGRWSLKLDKMEPGGPFPMTISGSNIVEYKQVYVGDVWLCGGQSNMDMVVGACDRADEANATTTPNMHLSWGGHWSPAAEKNNGGFSGTGYWFGRYLAEQMKDLHIGLIKCAVGGSRAEAWTPEAILEEMGVPGGELYKERLLPVIPYALKGVIWYQGEANTDQPQRYSQAMEVMIAAWRKAWNQPELPFLFMQLPRIGQPAPQPVASPNDGWALTREAQTFNLAIPNTGMAIYYETTDGDLHPRNKTDAGKRLALLALAKVYGRTPVEDYVSPVIEKATLKDGTLTISFSNAAKGLKTKDTADGSMRDLFIRSEDGAIKPARASVKGGELTIDLRDEKGLPDIFYAWSNAPQGNLYNAAGLPVSPFRLGKPKMGVDDCFGDTIILSQDVPFGPNALKPDSYRIPGYTISRVGYLRSSAYVQITVDRPFKIGQPITVELPGFRQWDGQTGFEPLKVIATPGHLAAGGFFKEMLIGEFHPDVKPDTCFKDKVIDIAKVDFPSAKTWKLVKSDGQINLAEGFKPVDNAVGLAHVYVYSAKDVTVNLWLGSDDGVQVYVNRELIHSRVQVRGCFPDSDRIANVKLRKGWNSVFFEVCQFAGGWGVMARIVDDKGGPVLGIGYQAERPADFKE